MGGAFEKVTKHAPGASSESRHEPARYPEKNNNYFLALLHVFPFRSVLKVAPRVVVSWGII